MKLASLEIQNFMAIGQTRLKLDDMGLVLIQGENQDDTSAASNGSGKSSVLDALCWCLYGETARGEAGDSIVNSVAGKGTSVRVMVYEAPYTYMISRFRKHKTGKNRLTLARVDRLPEDCEGHLFEEMTLGTDKLTQPLVDRLIGCTKQVFTAAIYSGQEKMPDLPGMTDTQLKELVEEAAGITTLQAAHEVARERWRLAEQRLSTVEALLKSSFTARTIAESTLSRVTEQSRVWDEQKGERVALAALRVMEAKKASDGMLTLIHEAEQQRDTLSLELAEIDAKIAGLKSEQTMRSGLYAELTAAARDTSKASGRRLTLVEQTRKAKHDYEHPMTATVGMPCRECGKKITEEDVAPARTYAVANARVELKRLADALREAQHNEKAALESEQNARTALETFESSMTDTSSLSARKRDIDSALKAIAKTLSDGTGAAREATEAAAAYCRVDAEKNPYTENIKSCGLAVTEHQERIDKGNADKEALEVETLLAKEAVRVYGPKGVRATILDTVTPFLNDRTAGYLNALSDGNLAASWSTLTLGSTGELMEKFSIAVTAKSGADRFGLLSGGEKRKVRLACAMALQDLVASRASKPINLLMADEIDDALDASGLERLMGILEEKARERGTVLVVSHNELSDWIREQVRVVKKGGVATLSGAMVLA